MNDAAIDEQATHYERLIDIGIALSAERDHKRLMETILMEAKDFSRADGGTLYLVTEDKHLKAAIISNDTLKICLGGTQEDEARIPPLPLYDPETGTPNHHSVATHVALTGMTDNTADAYAAEGFEFAGARRFDEANNYRSTSFLTVPLKNHDGDVIAVLQLINAIDPASGDPVAFDPAVEPLIEALASQAAVALDNQTLIEAQRKLFKAFIELLAGAIDAKSPYTGGHCHRVPLLAQSLVDVACKADEGPFKAFTLDDAGRYEVAIASWMHDCGKVTTPEYVVDKATKLETICDRIHEVRTRFEVLKRDAEITYLKGCAAGGDEAELRAAFDTECDALDADFAFVAECNIGSEFMAEDRVERLTEIAARQWTRTLDDRLGVSHEELARRERTEKVALPATEPLLADREDHIIHRLPGDGDGDGRGIFTMEAPAHEYNRGELYNLSIARGTLNAEERFKINDHIIQTILMLRKLPFPKHLRQVPEIAGGHHEKMNGEGYPMGLKRADMSIPARAMAIADIFEALTAADRPYKKAKTLSESLRIMKFMKIDGHVDPELFDLFLSSGVYRDYAVEHLQAKQIDDIDINDYLG